MIASYSNDDSIGYINSVYKEDETDLKFLLWIVIKMYDKKLLSSFYQITKESSIIKSYSNTSLVKTSAVEIEEILGIAAKLDHPIHCKPLDDYQEILLSQSQNEIEDSNKDKIQNELESYQPSFSMEQVKEDLNRYKELLEGLKELKAKNETITYTSEHYEKDDGRKESKKPLYILRKLMDSSRFRVKTKGLNKVPPSSNI